MNAETKNFIVHALLAAASGALFGYMAPNHVVGLSLILIGAILLSVSYIKIERKREEEDNGN